MIYSEKFSSPGNPNKNPKPEIIGSGNLVDAQGNVLKNKDLGIIVPDKEIIIPEELQKVQADRERLISEIEEGRINLRIKSNNFNEVYVEKAESFLKEVPSNTESFQNFKYFLEKFSVANHESVQFEKDREENFKKESTSLKEFELPEKVAIELLDFMFGTLESQNATEQEINISASQQSLLLRQIYHTFTYLKNFPYQRYKQNVLAGLVSANLDQRILFKNIISNFYLPDLSIDESKNIIHYLSIQKELSSDLAQAIFNRFEDLRQEFSQSEYQTLIKPESLKNVPIEELISDKKTWRKLALNEVSPYREIPNTKLGLELEFKLQGENQETHQRINKLIEKYQDILFSNGGKVLWQDQDVAEIAIGGRNGLEMSPDLIIKLNDLISELEKQPEFIAWGSNHIHVDAVSGINKDNSLFFFNDYDYDCDGKGFETKEFPLASPGNINAFLYILESETLADQMRVLALLYQQDTDKITADQALNYFTDLGSKGKNEAVENVLLDTAREFAPEALSSILRLGAKNRLPRLNEEFLAEKIDTLPGTVEVIMAVAQIPVDNVQKILVEKVKKNNIEEILAQVISSDKIGTLEKIKLQVLFDYNLPLIGTAEVIATINQEKSFGIQELLINKIDTLPGTAEVVTAIAQVPYYNIQEMLVEKIDTFPGTAEVITAIAQVSDYDVQEILVEKIDALPKTAEVIMAITQVSNYYVQEILAEKVKKNNIEEILAQVISSDKIGTLEKIKLQVLFDYNLPLPGTAEVITTITQTPDYNIQKQLIEKIDTLPGTVEIITAIIQVSDYDIQELLIKKIKTLPNTIEITEAIAKIQNPDIRDLLIKKIDTGAGGV